MKQEWMDRPVLCIFDIRQIQAFMFRANSYYDTLGGSDLMLHILNDALSFALKSVDPPLLYEQEMLVKEDYARRGDLPEKLLVMNRYAFTENDTLTLQDYRISFP